MKMWNTDQPPAMVEVLLTIERNCGKRYVKPGFLKYPDAYYDLKNNLIIDRVIAWSKYPNPYE